MSNHNHKHWHEGQSLVEFALVLPLLLLLMVVVLDIGILFQAQMIVQHAAWEGARAGATIADPEKGDGEIIGAVQQAAQGLDRSKMIIDIDPGQDESPRNLPFPAPRGEALCVHVRYQVELSFPHISIPISGRAVSIMEYQNQ